MLVEEIKTVLTEIEMLLSESDNSNDNQCNDMTLNHLQIALEWQKRKIKKPPDKSSQIDVCALMANRLR